MPLTSDYLRVHPFARPSSDIVIPSNWAYGNRPDIDALTSTANSLDKVSTAGLALKSRIDLFIDSNFEVFFLVADAADPSDPTGQVTPIDYNASTNNVHWEKAL